MALMVDDHKLLQLYDMVMDWKDSGLGAADYCRKHNILYKTMTNARYRVIHTQDTNPDEYLEYLDYSKEYSQGNLIISDFCKQKGINKSKLSDMNTHLKWLDRVKGLRSGASQDNVMKFVPVKSRVPATASPEPSSDNVKNDIELLISKGVRVIISPDIDSSRIIKIIELLKDL